MADCDACGNKVAKSAKALACDFCRLWYHMSCAGLTDSDCDSMKSRKGFGFHWFCGKCISSTDSAVGSDRRANQVDEKQSNIVAAVEGINQRLGDLEARTGSTGDLGAVSFANAVRRTISEVRGSEEPDTSVRDHGQMRVIKNKEVLVLKQRCPEGASLMPSSLSVHGLTNVLKSIPVKSCRVTSRGSVVVKFPHGEAKAEAKALVGSSADFTNVAVSEPKKMLPKMTLLDVPPSLSDGQIVSVILNKNPQIKESLNDGHTLTLVFSRVRDRKKMAVLKKSPEVSNAIARSSNHVFLGLTSCRAFDRFWATQCRHCQKLGHTKERCPKKDTSPVCGFCAGPHTSLNCPDKSVQQCVNCSSLHSPAERCHHSASSLDCPVMILERNRVMENTDFVSSKNA